MVIFTRKKEDLILTRIGKLCFVSFISAIAFSFVTTIFAVYLDSFFNNAVIVGLVSTFFTVIAMVSYFLFIPLIERFDKEKIYVLSLLVFAITYALFAINTSIMGLVIIGIFLFVAGAFRVTSFGIIIKNKSPRRKLSRNEGLVYTFANTSWIIGPLIAGIVAAKYGIRSMFVISAIIILIVIFIFSSSGIKDHKIKKRVDKSVYKNFVDFFKNKDRVMAYVLRGGVSFWWILIYLYAPLYIIRQGLGIEWVGYFLFAVPIPLILLEYKFSKIAEKTGFKKMFKIGYLITFIFCLLCFFVSNIFAIFAFVILASIGMAMLEPTTEAYFFDICKGKQDLRFYGPFNTALDSGKLLGKILPALVLLVLPFNYTFLLFGIIMFFLFLLSFRLRDVIERK